MTYSFFPPDAFKIAVTGHRPDKLGNEWDGVGPISDSIRQQLFQALSVHIDDPCDKTVIGISGMALGVDMIWAECLIYRKVPFVAAIPCAGQASRWPASSKRRYFDIVEHPLCTKHFVSTEPYRPELMQARNEWMVDNCDLLLAAWDGSPGGTANCVRYAKKFGAEIVKIKI
jgi:uncharacterized phage-like protein YoqJ